MHAKVGDKLRIHASHIGTPDQVGRIVEIRGANGTPPYLVDFLDGSTRLVFPGPDALVESARSAGHGSTDGPRRTRRVHTRVGW
jgi:hypothetical protein